MVAKSVVDQNLAEREAAGRFLFERIDYERAGAMPYDDAALGLARIRTLLERLGNPHHAMPIVHVAGTKGKGSTSAMIAAMLSAAGYRTGLYTSPHLDRIEERMAVDGRHATAEELIELVRAVRPAVEAMDRQAAESGLPHARPTYFEITTAMALAAFVRARVDVAVLEVGLGGRLDATNVCHPVASVITSISFDHTRQLGNTLASIAAEKAGIVKPGVPVVSGVLAVEARETIRGVCRDRGCRLIELGEDFGFDYEPPRHLELAPSAGRLTVDLRGTDWHFVQAHPKGTVPFSSNENWDSPPLVPIRPTGRLADLALPLVGRHQAANAAVAVATVAVLQQRGWKVSEDAIRSGLGNLRWPSRVEVVSRRPTVVLDAAHNVASVEALVESLDESFSSARRLLIIAGTQDKDHRGMLSRLLGKFDEVVFTRYLDNPRAVPPEQLEAIAAELTGRRWPVFGEPADAWDAIRRMAAPDDLICVTGSFFIAAEMRRQLAARPLEGAVGAEGEESAR